MKVRHWFLSGVVALLSTISFAAGDHDHKPKHGGIVVEAGHVDYELVAKADTLTLYLRDHDKKIDYSKITAKLTLLAGSDKQDVELAAQGDNLSAKGKYNVAPGTKVAATVNYNGRPRTVRFVLK